MTEASPRDPVDEGSVGLLRRDLYKLLSGLLLAAPEAPAVAALQDPDARDVLVSFLGDRVAAPLSAIAALRFDDELRREFFDLVAVPGPRYKPPFESVYCDARELDEGVVGGLLLGASSDAVKQRYAAAGFALEAPELPDHLGCELAFLSELAARELAAMERGDLEARRRAVLDAADFAVSHTARWISVYAARLATDGDARFLPAVAELAAALVAETVARGGRRRLPVTA